MRLTLPGPPPNQLIAVILGLSSRQQSIFPNQTNPLSDMNFRSIVLLLLAIAGLGTGLGAQNDVLFSYDGRQVTVDEFRYVFFKNNPAKKDPSLQDLKEYLDLYINFKLKVAEAEAARVDTIPTVRRDLNNYTDQLFRSYLERTLLDTLVREAYERMHHDIRASHILVSVGQDATPEDTLRAWNLAMNIRQRLMKKGSDFEAIAMEESQDRFASENKGDLGYLTTLTLPFYHFENTLYNTPENQVSMPVRTSLGYHLVRPVARRPAMGTVTVKHILIKLNEDASEEEVSKAKARIDSFQAAINGGASFDSLAMRYSDDQMSAPRGGLMEPFGAGRMVPAFEEEVYSLKEGQLSKPFRTTYGFHLVQMVERTPIGSFEEVEAGIRRKIQRDERFDIARQKLVRELQGKHGFVEFPDRLNAYAVYLDTTVLQASWAFEGFTNPGDAALFYLGNDEYTAGDLFRYIEQWQARRRDTDFETTLQHYYGQFRERTVLEHGLMKQYPDYARLRQEYHDGIMMFAMMDQEVWTRAIQDTAGLEAYWAENKSNHMWQQRIRATVVSVADEANAAKVAKQLRKKPVEKVLTKINKKKEVAASRNVTAERGREPLLDQVDWAPGLYGPLPDDDNGFAVVQVHEILAPMPKALHEARGLFISDYQQHLEREWVKALRSKYKVQVHENRLSKLLHN
jgi:peptidyl-prolyl cis-trans isomerase SurA